MQKQKLIVLTLLTLLVQPFAYSLPGDKEKQLERWIKNHQFLSPFYYSSPSMDYDKIILAFRQIQDNHFIDVSLLVNDGASIEEQLVLTQKEYIPNKDVSMISDKRSWETRLTVNVWKRDNQTAFDLLKSVYGIAVADDFKSSKLAFSGLEYFEEIPSEYCRCKIENIGQYKISDWARIEVFVGKKWAFEHSHKRMFAGMSDHHEFKIYPIKRALEDILILNHNTKMYNLFINIKKGEEDRIKPADIKVR